MLFLWVFGDNIEHTIGSFLYLFFYLLGGILASGAQILTDPSSMVPSVGASGAIAAVMGAYIVMFPRSQIRVLVIALGIWITRVSAILFLGIWFVTQFFNGVASLGVQTEQTGGVAFFAHIGGFVFGLLAGFLMKGRANEVMADQYEPYRPYDPWR
jgi:membrane associated rhomboid family serine protease